VYCHEYDGRLSLTNNTKGRTVASRHGFDSVSLVAKKACSAIVISIAIALAFGEHGSDAEQSVLEVSLDGGAIANFMYRRVFSTQTFQGGFHGGRVEVEESDGSES